MHIDSLNFSFVVQGPVYDSITAQALESIRKYFPESEIILSTWEGSSIDNLLFDKVVLSKDSGSFPRTQDSKILMNANRQYISSKNGIAVSSRMFTVKTRSDIVFNNNKLLDRLQELQKYNLKDEEFNFLKSRIIVTNVTSVNPNKDMKMPYHLCDWFYTGLTEDLKNLFDIPLYPEEEYASWYARYPKPANNTSDSLARYAAESYIISEFVKKYKNINFEHSFDVNANNIEMSERIIANNFMIFSRKQLGFYSLKNKDIPNHYLYNMYTYFDWIKLYKNYSCNKNMKMISLDLDKIQYGTAYYLRKISINILEFLHLKRLIKKILKVFRG